VLNRHLHLRAEQFGCDTARWCASADPGRYAVSAEMRNRKLWSSVALDAGR
jgi:hypothetical protein